MEERIIIAEDQLINMEVMKSQMKICKKLQFCDICINGEEALSKATNRIEEGILKFKASNNKSAGFTQIRPISLMLLDFQMPRLNGLQVVEGVRTLIRLTNEKEKVSNLRVEEPRFVFLTAFLTTAFRQHIIKMNIREAYEKPI
jgi:CheY-like chemotaxis protein